MKKVIHVRPVKTSFRFDIKGTRVFVLDSKLTPAKRMAVFKELQNRGARGN